MMKRVLRTLIVFSYFFYVVAVGVSIISAFTFEAAQASPKDP